MRHGEEAGMTRGDRSDRVCQAGGRGGGMRSKRRSPNGSLQQWWGRQDQGEVCHVWRRLLVWSQIEKER